MPTGKGFAKKPFVRLCQNLGQFIHKLRLNFAIRLKTNSVGLIDAKTQMAPPFDDRRQGISNPKFQLVIGGYLLVVDGLIVSSSS